MTHRRAPTATEAFTCVGAFVTVTFAVIVVDAATLPQGKTLTREGGGIETMSMLGYLVAVAVYLRNGPLPPFWPVPVLLLFMSARESDADKMFTSEGVLSTKILFYDTPLWEKLLALGVWAVLAASVLALIRYRGPALIRALWCGTPWALAFTAGFLLAAFSKTIDGLARKLAPWKIDIPPGVDKGAGTLEECLEVLVPIFFMIAILLRARAASGDRGPRSPDAA